MPQPIGNFVQYFYVTPLIVKVQYAKWEDLLAMPDFQERFAFAHAFSKWSKGLAYAETGKPGEAKRELAFLQAAMKHPDLQVLNYPFNKPVDQIAVGEKILLGIIAQKENKIQEAISILKEAVTAEDKLVYQEPRDWLNPSRIYLANMYVIAGNLVEAEKTLKEDLVINPHNYHSLTALKKIYFVQKNKASALKKVEQELKENYQ